MFVAVAANVIVWPPAWTLSFAPEATAGHVYVIPSNVNGFPGVKPAV